MNSYQDYIKYLKSNKWKSLREKVFRYKGRICRRCGRKRAYVVHHRNYERIGKERLSDLIPVCNKCHNEIHLK